MNRPVFVDTSAWFALADGGDSNHRQAAQRFRQLARERRTLLTTNHVIGETYTVLRVRLGSSVAHGFLRRARDSEVTQRVFISPEWEAAAEDILYQYVDQDFSYVDATSFVVMRRLNVREAFAFDHHFAIAGFALLGDG